MPTIEKIKQVVWSCFVGFSKTFNTINHEKLANLNACGFSNSALQIFFSYLSDRWQGTKGPFLFNIFINDFFCQLVNCHMCNFADDTTLTACGIYIKDLLNYTKF